MHLITKNKMKIKYIGYFTIFFLTILSLYNVNSNALEIDKKVYAGNKDAKVTVKVFSSLTCPYCADFHKNIYPRLKEDFIDKGHAYIEFRNFPLDIAALNASKIVHCKNDGNSKILHLLYEKQNDWIQGEKIEDFNSSCFCFRTSSIFEIYLSVIS